MQKKWLGLVGISAVIVAALLYLRWGSRAQDSIPIARGTVHESVYGLGTVVSEHIYRHFVGVPVTVRELFVKEGQEVKKGDPLLRLEGGVNRAPFDGTITSLPYRVGELAVPQTPVLTLTDLKNLYLEVSLEQLGALRIKTGQKALLSFESLRSQKLAGHVRAVYPKDGQFLIHILVDQFPTGVMPGMTADVAIEVGQKENALLVPVTALTAGKIMIDRQGKRLKLDVQVGVVDSEMAEIRSDELKPDDRVVVKGR